MSKHGKVEWRKPSVRTYEDIKEEELSEKGVLPLKFKSNKREQKKFENIKKIVDVLPSTLQVLNKRTALSKTTLKRYLEKLIWIDVVRKELDMYFLNDDFKKSRNPRARPPIIDIWERWFSALPEYRTPSVLSRGKDNLMVKLVLRGTKPMPTKETVKRKLKSYKKKHGK